MFLQGWKCRVGKLIPLNEVTFLYFVRKWTRERRVVSLKVEQLALRGVPSYEYKTNEWKKNHLPSIKHFCTRAVTST